MRYIIFITIIVSRIACFGQLVPQMQIKTSEFKPSTFTPSTYTPQQPDYSILQRSLQQREDRANKATESYVKLLELYSDIASKIPPSEKGWYENYAGKLCKNVKDNIDIGNYGSAITMAYDAMSTLRNDKQIVYRIDSYKQYCDDLSFKGSSYNKGKVNKETYDYWLYKNQYAFKPKYDLQGIISGFTPITVTWLHENINWNDLINFITSNGNNSKKVVELWNLYFMDGSKSASLLQEFEVNNFYLTYYTYCLEQESLSSQERVNLNNQVTQLKRLLLDSNNQPSYETFVKNIQNDIQKSIISK